MLSALQHNVTGLSLHCLLLVTIQLLIGTILTARSIIFWLNSMSQSFLKVTLGWQHSFKIFQFQNMIVFAMAGLQSRCGSVFSLLAAAACPDSSSGDRVESPGRRRLGRPHSMLKLLQRQHKLHTSHALSMDVLLGRGLELGSHSPDCWAHVFRLVPCFTLGFCM
jgi:hypothetical protein